MSVSPILSFLEGPELLIIAAIILVLFGGAKLPQLARSLGSAQREFKKGLNGDEDEEARRKQAEERLQADPPKSPDAATEGRRDSSDVK